MHNTGINPGVFPSSAVSFERIYPISWRAWLLHSFLLALTFLTATGFGAGLVENFRAARPFNEDLLLETFTRLWHLDRSLWQGLLFSLPLLLILLAHEMGHYLECRRRGVDASLPYFLPSPLMFGTFGAFIRIRSPIYTREALFDIGIKGPIAGFITLLPFLVTGVWLSKNIPVESKVVFGAPFILRLVEWTRFGGLEPHHILLHPVAMAAWVGLFATALNLLPIGQLDGGHILYAIAGNSWHKRIGIAIVGLLAVDGFLYWPWWMWAVVMFFFGRRHVLIYDATPVSRSRLVMAAVALVIFLLSVSIVPVHGL